MTSVILYIAAICAANISVWYFGPWISPINSFILIGLDLALRDTIHDRYGVKVSLIATMIAGVVSFIINPATSLIAVASVVSFIISNVGDCIVYNRLRTVDYVKRSNASNVTGAILDSALFPLIAFGGFFFWVSVAQFAAKVAGAALFTYVFARYRDD